ncbi:MAG: LVIVD repeat-containing protein, partial [Candidatus Binatia bacterium]
GPDASAPDAMDHGRYADPEDFPSDGCVPGGFADGDLEAIFHIEIDPEGFTFTDALRLDRVDGGWSGLVAGGAPSYVRVDDDVVIAQVETDSGAVIAEYFCARDPDGTVRGYDGYCPPADQPEGECSTVPMKGVAIEQHGGPSSGLRLLGEYGPWPYDPWAPDGGISVNVRVAGEVAYLARYQDGLRILDIGNPANIVERGHQPTEFPDDFEFYNDVKIADGPNGKRYALMGSSVAGVVVVDVTDPASPAIVQHFGTRPGPGEAINVHTLFVDAGRAYITVLNVGFEIWDIADPAAPVRLGGFEHPAGDAYLHDLSVQGDRAYLNYWDLGMAIVDVSNPASPTLVGSFENYGQTSSHSNWVTQIGDRKIAVHGDEQWGSHVHLVDVTEGTAAFATSIGEWETRPEVSVHNVMAAGTRAYLAYYQDGVRVLDIADPAKPRAIAHFQTHPGYDRRYGRSFFEGAIGIDLDLARQRIYVADSHRGLIILELE